MRLCAICGDEIKYGSGFHLQCYRPLIDLSAKETRKARSLSERIIQTELGIEVLCIRCEDYYPNDKEFFSGAPLKPFPYCKACETETQAERRARERRLKQFVESFGKLKELKFEII